MIHVDTRVRLPVESIAELCRRFGVERLEVFGSVLREDFGPDSDVDLLVVFRDDDYGPWFEKLLSLQDELEALLGRKVDLVERKNVERSQNYIRRRHILSTARPIYVEG